MNDIYGRKKTRGIANRSLGWARVPRCEFRDLQRRKASRLLAATSTHLVGSEG